MTFSSGRENDFVEGGRTGSRLPFLPSGVAAGPRGATPCSSGTGRADRLSRLPICQRRKDNDEDEAHAQQREQQLVLAAHVSLGKR